MKTIKKIFIVFLLSIQIFSITVFSVNTDDLDLTANGIILIEENSGIVLYEKNSKEKMYPASTTKILTAILVLENCELSDIVTVSSSALEGIPYGYVTAGLYSGEQLTVEDLLYALLLKSANEVAVIFAEHVSGSVEEFSKLMNNKAKEIGCTNTHFVNPNGIHNENHYTTPYDLALIAQYCMKNETFKKIVSTEKYTLPKTNKYAHADRSFENTNALILHNSSYYYEFTTGIKTGYTSEAKNCLISSASKNDVNLISVVLGAGTTSNNKNGRFTDTKQLFEYGFENFGYSQFKTEGDVITTLEIENATDETKKLDLKIENSLTCFSDLNLDFENLEKNISLNENIVAPISQNQILGTVTYNIEGIEYKSNLLASTDVIKKPNYAIYIIISGVILLLLGIFILVKKSNSKKKKRNTRVRNLNRKK